MLTVCESRVFSSKVSVTLPFHTSSEAACIEDLIKQVATISPQSMNPDS